MILYPDQFIDRRILIFNEYEPELIKVLKTLLKEGDNIMDIGANIGYISLVAAQLIKGNGHVFSFEPSPEMYDKLKTNILENHTSNITAFPFAISNHIGDAQFFINNTGNSGMSSFRQDNSVSPIKVNAITIDSILQKLPKIRLLKIDIEGAEFKAISGMKSFIQRDRPTIIIEFTDQFLQQMDSSSSDLFQLLENHGYHLWRINEKLIPLNSAPEYQCNVICIHNKEDERIMCNLVEK